MVKCLEYWNPSWFSSSWQMLFHTSYFFIFSTKCLIRKAAPEYFRSRERKRIMDLKEAIHTCGGKVVPLFKFSTANGSNFFICYFTLYWWYWWYYQILLLHTKPCLLNVAWPPLSLFTHSMSIKYMQLSSELMYLHIIIMVSCYTLAADFQNESWDLQCEERKFPLFSAANSATCCLKAIAEIFPGSDTYHHENIARQV